MQHKKVCIGVLILILSLVFLPVLPVTFTSAASDGSGEVIDVATTFADQSTNTTLAAAPCSFNLYATDNNTLSGFIFETNNTGSPTNDTWASLAGASSWMNVTKTLNSTGDYVVSSRWYVNDTGDNWVASSQYNMILTYVYVTLQARDKDGVNLPRGVIFSGSYSNTTTYSISSNTNGYYLLPAIYGSVTVAVTWQSHLIKSSSNVTVTANSTQNLDTLVARLTSGANYALISLNNTSLVTPSLDGQANIFLHGVNATGEIEIKIDHVNWRTTVEPTRFEAGTGQYNTGDGTWEWTAGILTINSTYSGTQDILLRFPPYQETGGEPHGGTEPQPTPTPTPTPSPSSPPSDSNFQVLDLNLGSITPNSTVTVKLRFRYSSSPYLVTNITLSEPFRTWLVPSSFQQQLFTLGAGVNTGEITLQFRIPSNVTLQNYNGTVTLTAQDAFGNMHTSSAGVQASVVSQVPADNSLLRNLLVTICLALVSVVTVVALVKRRR